jgi:fido (protein-threonine AMPylation protein)
MKDIYLYENSNVLKNKLNITDKLELETAEADFLSYRILELDKLIINDNIQYSVFIPGNI